MDPFALNALLAKDHAPGSADLTPSRGRRKLWEVDRCFKCSLIGTCLSRVEMRKLARDKVFSLVKGLDDYQLHAAFIECSDCKDKRGRALHKHLDRKYRAAIKRYSKAQDDNALKALWKEDFYNGRIDGPWWAILSHPWASAELTGWLYGKLHMLGHDSLNQYHREQARKKKLLAKVEMLEDVLTSERGHFRLELQALSQENATLRGELLSLEQERNHLDQTCTRLPLEDSTDAHQEEMNLLRQANSVLQGHVDQLIPTVQQLQKELKVAHTRLQSMESAVTELEAHKEEQARELASVEQLLAGQFEGLLPCEGCQDQHTAQCPGPSLCGKTIVYVGGLHKMVPHYRQLVEKMGGQFMHHDGGKEASRNLLPKMLSTADAVLCPIDCVSHDACNCVKKICKRYQKPFVLMRSSGLSSLAKGLTEMVQ